MPFKRFGEFEEGYNPITDKSTDGSMRMEAGIVSLSAGCGWFCIEPEREAALLLLEGRLEACWSGKAAEMSRGSLFDENPWCLHVPKNCRVELKAAARSEILVLKAENSRGFEPVLYSPGDVRGDVFGDGVWGGTARRIVRTVFDYSNAPYSNLVMGEVITFPGKWSSYIPHDHPQPEIYYYRFNKPQGFGCCFIGEEAFKVTHNSMAAIPGGLVHPQASAPGYAMYYCWMIRHLENNPWTSRIDQEEHKWLLDPASRIWPEA